MGHQWVKAELGGISAVLHINCLARLFVFQRQGGKDGGIRTPVRRQPTRGLLLARRARVLHRHREHHGHHVRLRVTRASLQQKFLILGTVEALGKIERSRQTRRSKASASSSVIVRLASLIDFLKGNSGDGRPPPYLWSPTVTILCDLLPGRSGRSSRSGCCFLFTIFRA